MIICYICGKYPALAGTFTCAMCAKERDERLRKSLNEVRESLKAEVPK